MNDRRWVDGYTLDGALSPLAARLGMEFAIRLEESLKGGVNPRLDDFLNQAAEEERDQLMLELQRIERDFHSQVSQRTLSPQADTTDDTIIPPTPVDLNVTLDSQDAMGQSPPAPRQSVHVQVDKTIDSPPPVDKTIDSPPATDKTIDSLPPALHDPNQTVESSIEVKQPKIKPEKGAPKPTVAGYELLGELGRGGMGVVYKARHVKLHRVVALKMVLAGAHANPDQLARFHVEAEAVAQFQHPNIVQIFEVSEHDGLPFFSLEYVDGGSLSDKIKGKPMQPAEAAEIVELLAIAMACAHANGVIHRDLKPANVLLTKDGLPKITDFGLAKRLESDSGATRSGALMGTPSYMAPEQAMGDTHHIGPPADIYALGVILYELLTGRTPFVGSSIMDTLEQVRKAEPVPPRRLVPKIPKDVETICLKCLQKEQYKRYSSADDLAADLRRFRDGKPISARPVGTVERAWRWCRRNPRIAALSSLVGLLVVAVAITWIVMAGNAARERKAIEETRQFAEQRLQKAGDAVHDGDFVRAQDLVRWSDPLLENTSDLGDVRGRLTELRDQLAIYIEFKTALDNARYHGLFGSKATLKKAQGYCTWVLQIIGQIEQLQSNGRRGLPPLTDEQLELYREDVFESYLVAAQVEMSLASGAKSADQKASAARALEWLNRAERALPGMRVLHVRRGDILRTLGEVEAARKDSTTANGIVPRSAVDLFWHGIEEHERGDTARPASLPQAQRHYRNAMEDYAKLVRIRPDHFWAYFDWAECQYELNDSYDAIVGFTTCIHVRRDVAWPYYNRGNIYLNLKQFDLAIQDYDDAIKKHPEYTTAYYNRGIAHWETKRSDLAIADLDQAIALDPEYSRPYLKKAQIYRSLKEYDKAEREYEKAIAAEPAYAEAFTDRATMYFQRGDLAKAREDFSRVIAIQPSDPTGYANRGTINLLAANPEAALADWIDVTKLDPKNSDAFYYAAIILRAQRQYDRALALLQNSINLKPNHATYYSARAQVYRRQGQFQKALDDLNHILTKIEVKAEVLNDRGELYRAMAKLKESEADYAQSIKMAPKQTDAYIGLAATYVKQGKATESESCYDKMVAVNPDAAKVYLRRGEYRRDVGKFDLALADCDKAASLDPKTPHVALLRASISAARGNGKQAILAGEKALEGVKRSGAVNHDAACIWSLASKAADVSPEMAKAYSDKAAAFLKDALEKGFLDLNYEAINRMPEEPALAPILGHPIVKELFK